MDVSVSVKINASPEQVWQVFKDISRWGDWYGVPLKDADWREGGFVRYGGQYGGQSQLKNYREAATVTCVDRWADDIYSVRADGNGSIFSKTVRPKNGANFTASGYPNECKKQQSYLDKFRDIVEREYTSSSAPTPAAAEPATPVSAPTSAAAEPVKPASTPTPAVTESAPSVKSTRFSSPFNYLAAIFYALGLFDVINFLLRVGSIDRISVVRMLLDLTEVVMVILLLTRKKNFLFSLALEIRVFIRFFILARALLNLIQTGEEIYWEYFVTLALLLFAEFVLMRFCERSIFDTPEQTKKRLQYAFFVPAVLYFIAEFIMYRFDFITKPSVLWLGAAMFFSGWALVPSAKEQAE